jgi:hypothetical protein
LHDFSFSRRPAFAKQNNATRQKKKILIDFFFFFFFFFFVPRCDSHVSFSCSPPSPQRKPQQHRCKKADAKKKAPAKADAKPKKAPDKPQGKKKPQLKLYEKRVSKTSRLATTCRRVVT